MVVVSLHAALLVAIPLSSLLVVDGLGLFWRCESDSDISSDLPRGSIGFSFRDDRFRVVCWVFWVGQKFDVELGRHLLGHFGADCMWHLSCSGKARLEKAIE